MNNQPAGKRPLWSAGGGFFALKQLPGRALTSQRPVWRVGTKTAGGLRQDRQEFNRGERWERREFRVLRQVPLWDGRAAAFGALGAAFLRAGRSAFAGMTR